MATRANNLVLAHQVDFTKTDLVKTRDTQLVTTCSAIEELALQHQAALTDFRITVGDLARLPDAINRFSESLPRTRVTVVEHEATNKKLNDLFVQTDALLKNQLDRLMVCYRETQPVQYNTYRNSRRIINYGIRHEKKKEPENAVQDVNS